MEPRGGGSTIDLSHTHTSASHTHDIASHVHSTGNHTLTVSEIPAHNHILRTYWYGGDLSGYSFNWSNGARQGSYDVTSGSWPNAGSMDNTGGGGAHNHGNTGGKALTTNSTTPGSTGSSLSSTTSIMQPYIVMYIWRRTE